MTELRLFQLPTHVYCTLRISNSFTSIYPRANRLRRKEALNSWNFPQRKTNVNINRFQGTVYFYLLKCYCESTTVLGQHESYLRITWGLPEDCRLLLLLLYLRQCRRRHRSPRFYQHLLKFSRRRRRRSHHSQPGHYASKSQKIPNVLNFRIEFSSYHPIVLVETKHGTRFQSCNFNSHLFMAFWISFSL